MGINPDKLARAASKSQPAPVDQTVQVSKGFGLSAVGMIVAALTIGLASQLVAVALGWPTIPAGSGLVVLMTIAWVLKARGVLVEAVLGRSEGTAVVFDMSPWRRNPVRQVRKRYEAGSEPVFGPARSWWRLPTLTIDGDEWFVARGHVSDAERWYAAP